jgi:hypothetical protein
MKDAGRNYGESADVCLTKTHWGVMRCGINGSLMQVEHERGGGEFNRSASLDRFRVDSYIMATFEESGDGKGRHGRLYH